MKTKLLWIFLVTATLSLHVGCTSGDEKSSSGDETASAPTDSEDLDGTPDGGGDKATAKADEAAPAEGDATADDGTKKDEQEVMADLGDDEGLDKELAGDKKDTTAPTDASATAQDGTTPPADGQTPTDTASTTPSTDSSAASTEAAPSTDTGSTATAAADLAAPAPSGPPATLKKVKDAPFKQAGMLLNTVYIARKGDNIKNVSQKLFGKDQKAMLIKANPYLKRGVKVGDKIYYNSPQRPQDADRMLTYYEDKGIPSEMYVAKDGDDLKKVAQSLLGAKESWKELWVTNPALETKTALQGGTEVRYWPKDAGGPTMDLAQNAPPPETHANNPPPPSNDLPPPPPANVADNNPPPPGGPNGMNNPPPPPAGAAAGAMAPPPPGQGPNPPPVGDKPPTELAAKKKVAPPPAAETTNIMGVEVSQDTLFLGGVGVLLLVGGGLVLSIIRKSRMRKLNETQI